MGTLDQSDELIRHGNELRARSLRARAAADEKMEKSRRLIAASAQAREVALRAYGSPPPGRMGTVTAADLPAGR